MTTSKSSRNPEGNETARPLIEKLGTIDCDMVETTPVVFRGRLYRFEYVRPSYAGNELGEAYFRFVDVASGQLTPPFGRTYELGSAYVGRDEAYAFGVNRWGGEEVRVFRSRDLEHWESQTALELPGWGAYNTSVCKAGDRYIMAVELGEPPEVVGVRFTMRFAESRDLTNWQLLPEECIFSTDRYTACPALRYLDGCFYMIYLEQSPGPTFNPHIVRSHDLVNWQSSPLNPVLHFCDEEDKRIGNRALTEEQRQRIATATDINNSDVDLCEFEGKTIIYYCWGNQQGNEFLAQAIYKGPMAALLRGFFPEC